MSGRSKRGHSRWRNGFLPSGAGLVLKEKAITTTNAVQFHASEDSGHAGSLYVYVSYEMMLHSHLNGSVPPPAIQWESHLRALMSRLCLSLLN